MKLRFWSSIHWLVTVALLVLSSGALLYAQSTTDGAIGGTVYDTNGAVVANAKVVVHNNGTNAETANTNGSGYFRVNKLQPGAIQSRSPNRDLRHSSPSKSSCKL